MASPGGGRQGGASEAWLLETEEGGGKVRTWVKREKSQEQVTCGQGRTQGTLFCKGEKLLGRREGWGIPLDPSDLVLNLKLVLVNRWKNQPLEPHPRVLPKALGGHVSEFWK